MACNGCNCQPPDPQTGTRETWKALLFLAAIGGALVFALAR